MDATASRPPDLRYSKLHFIPEFAGICTKKERVIQDQKLNKWKIPPRLFGKEVDFEWKTSDWVMQELGYSLGLGMDTILLLEEGIREVNGLHGTLEFIRFNRQNPSLAFQKIIQQLSSIEINNIKPGQPDVSAKSTDGNNAEKSDTQKSQSSLDYKNPSLDWEYSDFVWAMHMAIWDKDSNAESRIYEFHKKLLSTDKPLYLKWEGECLYIKQKWKNESALGKLNSLIKTNPEIAHLHYYLGKSFEEYKDYGKAYDEYVKALSVGSASNAQFLSSTIGCLKAYKGSDAAKTFMEANIENIVKNDDDKFLFIKTYATLFKDDAEHTYCALLEAALYLKPDESSLRFDLAYKYSALKLKRLSLFHYELLSRTSPSSTVWNNLGVEYENNSLPIKSIGAYRTSEGLDGTLAMSNIAYRFVNAGFDVEAREICNKALKIEDYDSRIPEAINGINGKVVAENKVIETLSDEIKPEQDYFIKFAISLANPLINDMIGKCKSDECELNFSITGGLFAASGAFERKKAATGLAGLYNPYSGANKQSNDKIISHKIVYQGLVRGRSGTFKVTREARDKDGAAPTLLGLAMDQSTKDGMFYFDDVNSVFEMVELTSDGQSLAPYKLKIITP
ncbi:MAG: hypothetical protein WAW75_08400 [Gallionella sp.]